MQLKYTSKKRMADVYRGATLLGGRLVSASLAPYRYEPMHRITATDVVICGYPKSGNTWVQNLFAGAFFGVSTEYMPDALSQELVPDLDYKITYKRLHPDQMFFCTHGYPNPLFRNVVHLVRDPRDVMASYAAMNAGLGRTASVEDMVLRGEDLYFGRWHEHTRAWLDNPHGARVVTLRYEDLLASPVDEIERVLKEFAIDRPRDVIERAVKGSSLAQMKRKEERYGFDKRMISADKWSEGASFVRAGKAGGHSSELTPSLVEAIVKDSAAEMRSLGYLES